MPPSTNNIYYNTASGRRLTTEARNYKKLLQQSLVRFGVKKSWAIPPFELHIKLYFPDARKADASNRIKLAEDALLSYFGHDDSLVYRLVIDRYIDRSSPRIVMTLHHTERKLDV